MESLGVAVTAGLPNTDSSGLEGLCTKRGRDMAMSAGG